MLRRVACPVCGLNVAVPGIRSHVASDPCLARYKQRGEIADPERGPDVLSLVRKLDRLLREEPR